MTARLFRLSSGASVRRTFLLLCLFCIANAGFAQVPQTLSYQGVLTDASGNAVADGDVSIVFRLYDAAEGGMQLWEEKQTVTVVNGIFNVILGKEVLLDLPFDRPFWLEIELSEEGVVLEPRIELTSSAYSLNARSIADSVVTGEKIADGSIVRSVNGLTDAVELDAGTNVTITPDGQSLVISAEGGNGGPTDGWALDGNAGIDPTINFVGTTDSAALELRVANQRVMRYEPETAEEGPNVIGGWSGNSVAEGVVGAAIGGGGTPDSNLETKPNQITASYGMIGGGFGNAVSAFGGTIAGGSDNVARGFSTTVGGGSNNTASDFHATVAGGNNNTASGTETTVGGGRENIASGSTAATVSGGSQNVASGGVSFVGGGFRNTASAAHTTVGGGVRNVASSEKATVSGGGNNEAAGAFATVPGGQLNHARGDYSLAAGYLARAAHEGSFVWSDRSSISDSLVSTAQNQFLIRATGGVGIGTDTPTAQLSVGSSGTADFLSAITVGTSIQNVTANLTVEGSAHISQEVGIGTIAPANLFSVNGDADFAGNVGIGTSNPDFPLEMASGAHVTKGGVWTDASSRSYKEDITALTEDEAMATLQQLNPVKFKYKTEMDEVYLGFIAEDVPELVAMKDRKSLSPMDIVAILARVVQSQQGVITKMQREMDSLKQKTRQ